MDFETIRDKTKAVLANPRILTFTLIGTTTLLIGAFLFFGDDKEEVVMSSEPQPSEELPFEELAPKNIFETTEEKPVEQMGGNPTLTKKKRQSKRLLAHRSKMQLDRRSKMQLARLTKKQLARK